MPRPVHHLLARRAVTSYSGEFLPPVGNYGITSDGLVWLNSGSQITYWSPGSDYKYPEVANSSMVEYLQRKNVGFRYNFDTAVGIAKQKTGATDEDADAPTLPVKLVGKTWNDGSYTYEVRSPTKAFVPETGVTFEAPATPTKDRWERFVKQLTAANLKEGKATGKPKSSGGGAVAATTVSATPLPGPEESITDKVWFWPVAILVPTTLVIGGILLWPSKKKAPAAAPAAAPAV